MVIPRLEYGENLTEVIRERFNLLAEAVEQCGRLEGDGVHIAVDDTGYGKIIRWTGQEGICGGRNGGAASGGTAVYAGPFAVSVNGGTATVNAGEAVIGEVHHSVAETNLTLTAGQSETICLFVHYGNGVFTCGVNVERGNLAGLGMYDWYKRLAHVNAQGEVTQYHQSGDVEVTGRWI